MTGRQYAIATGAAVEVRTRFDGRWSSGFEVAGIVESDPSHVSYRLRRLSDGVVLPDLFSDEEIAPESGWVDVAAGDSRRPRAFH